MIRVRGMRRCDMLATFPSHIGFSNVAETTHKMHTSRYHDTVGILSAHAIVLVVVFSSPYRKHMTRKLPAESNIYHHRARMLPRVVVCVFVYEDMCVAFLRKREPHAVSVEQLAEDQRGIISNLCDRNYLAHPVSCSECRRRLPKRRQRALTHALYYMATH